MSVPLILQMKAALEKYNEWLTMICESGDCGFSPAPEFDEYIEAETAIKAADAYLSTKPKK
jgi:hypothetical protein